MGRVMLRWQNAAHGGLAVLIVLLFAGLRTNHTLEIVASGAVLYLLLLVVRARRD